MKKLIFVLILIFAIFKGHSADPINLEYKLEEKDGKNFLVINDFQNATKKSRKLKRKIIKKRKKKKKKQKRKLGGGIFEKLQQNAGYLLNNLGSGAMAGALAGKYKKHRFLKVKKMKSRQLHQWNLKNTVISENINDLFKVKLLLRKIYSNLKSVQKSFVFKLHSREDEIVKLLGELQV